MRTFAAVVLAAAALSAQDLKIPLNFDKLAAKAVESVDVTLDSSMLQLAGKFLSGSKPDEAGAKRLIDGLKGIYVRSFEFAKPGEYSPADVEALRAQLKSPLWSRIVGVRSQRDGENADIFLKKENDRITGLAIIAANPKELTIVSIAGSIHPEDLNSLGGQFGIPKVEVAPPKGEKK